MAIQKEDQLPVRGVLIAWARDRAGYTVDEAQKYFKKIDAWEREEAFPTYPQLEAMADKFKCPVAVFFFPEPPKIEPVTESFRTLTQEDVEYIPRPIRLLLRRGKAMKLNLAELNEQRNPATKLITRDLRFAPDVPNICEHFGVGCVDLEKFMEIEGWTF